MEIELKRRGPKSLESVYLSKTGELRGHYTGNQIKLLPYKTNPSGNDFVEDFKFFQGIIGELFRILNSKSQVELGKLSGSFKLELKETILKTAIEKVDTEQVEEFKNILTKLFFDEENGLIKFNIKTLLYMNFIHSDSAIKEVSKFIHDIFLVDNLDINYLDDDSKSDNLLHQLILESLPELQHLETKSNVSKYHNFFPELKKLFLEDFTFLKSNNSFLLKHVENIFKYYYFQYVSQLIINFNSYGNGERTIKPIYFTLDWETLSESRLSNHSIGWKELNTLSPLIFAHVNTIELLNYIQLDGKIMGDYHNISLIYKGLNSEEKEKIKQCINEIITFYTDSIPLKTGSWADCNKKLNFNLELKKFDTSINKEIYRLWHIINYQFANTERKNADVKYGKWFSNFASLHYVKQRGRLGNTTVLSQELLLFITRICIGNEDKIRLKSLWEKFRERGIAFDETSKLEIARLFEKINLIEKKSDSGDAQYVKSYI